MTTNKKMAPVELPLAEAVNQNPDHFQEAGEPMTSIVDHTPNKGEFFDSTLTVDARFAGGTITITPEPVDWIGDTLVRVEIPGLTSPLMLRTYEARDLAAALQALAQHIDEDARPITRCTEPGAPSFEDVI